VVDLIVLLFDARLVGDNNNKVTAPNLFMNKTLVVDNTNKGCESNHCRVPVVCSHGFCLHKPSNFFKIL
jgi:hypothetical protein